jgi:hypothetical protein
MVSRRLALATLGLAFAACGPSADAYPFLHEGHCCDAGAAHDANRPHDAGRMDSGPPVVPPEPLEDWDTTGAGPLTGIFALEVQVLANVVVDLETRQLYRVRLLQNGTNVRARIQACVIDLATINGVASLSFTHAAEDAIRSHVLEFQGDYLSAADPLHAVFAPPRATVVIGAMLAMPETDPLPTMMNPSLAIDEDHDGNPGVTIDATAVVCRDPQQAYAAFRASVLLNGTVDDLDVFQGTADPTVDQSVLGYTDGCLSVATSLNVMVRPGSTFHAHRVGDAEDLDHNGNVSCPEIAWAAPGFFGDYWLR